MGPKTYLPILNGFVQILRFTGSYEGNKGQGELVEMFGFGVATVDDQLRQLVLAFCRFFLG